MNTSNYSTGYVRTETQARIPVIALIPKRSHRDTAVRGLILVVEPGVGGGSCFGAWAATKPTYAFMASATATTTMRTG